MSWATCVSMTLSSAATLMILYFFKAFFYNCLWFLLIQKFVILSSKFVFEAWQLNSWVAPCLISGPAEWRLKSCIDYGAQQLTKLHSYVVSTRAVQRSSLSPGEFPAIMSELSGKSGTESPRKTEKRLIGRQKTVAHSSRQWIEGSRTDKKDTHLGPTDNSHSTRSSRSCSNSTRK